MVKDKVIQKMTNVQKIILKIRKKCNIGEAKRGFCVFDYEILIFVHSTLYTQLR